MHLLPSIGGAIENRVNHKKMDKLVDGADGGGPSSPLMPISINGKRSPVRLRREAANAGRSASRMPGRGREGVLAARRQLLADFCQFIGRQLLGLHRVGHDAMAPRLRQTLNMLLEGDAEKQIARKLDISPHTVHVYVKKLYRHFEVSSRGELLALFIQKT